MLGGSGYDVPEKFRKLHQLALQQVHQVRGQGDGEGESGGVLSEGDVE